jgi:hypothetical protein
VWEVGEGVGGRREAGVRMGTLTMLLGYEMADVKALVQ